MLAVALYTARQFEAAVQEAQAGIDLDPSYYSFHLDLGWALAGLGRCEEAVKAFRAAANVAPGDPLTQGHLGWGLAVLGSL